MDIQQTRFEPVEEVGTGAMGRVTLARDSALERQVVVKTLLSDHADDPESATRLLDEARIAGSLEHPNIVPIYDMGRREEGEPYIVMRYVRGESLGAVVGRLRDGDADTHRSFSFARRLSIVAQVCEAMHYAHSREVLHRDLKPDNIMIGPFGEVLVMDWGIASALNQRGTSRNELYCTPTYAAPELMQGAEASALTDVYSLGAFMYELFCLHPPYKEDDLNAMLAAVLNKTPRHAQAYAHPAQGHVPREIANVIMKAMAREPEARYQSVLEVAEALRAYQEGRAPVVCACTATKRVLFGVEKLVDNYGEALIGGLLAMFGVALIYGLYLWFGR